MKISVRRPDDFHVHFRDVRDLRTTVPHTARTFARALVMPNTSVPVVDGAGAEAYRRAIVESTTDFTPLMTVQLLESTTPEMVQKAKGAGITAVKFYPRGATTNSDNGVRDLLVLQDVLSAVEECGLVLCLHGEIADAFCMDREKEFVKRVLMPIAKSFPKLRIVLEHASTADAVGYVENLPDNVAATITAHHLVLTLDDVIGDKMRPHHFCKPVAKTPVDRAALKRAATSGSPKFFLGTDSAPHPVGRKECDECCAGIFSAPVAMEVLAQVFEEEGRLDELEGFTSEHGARFYGLPLNGGKVVLRKEPWDVPTLVGRKFVPFMAGKTLQWKTG